jgi:hypothetical protein
MTLVADNQTVETDNQILFSSALERWRESRPSRLLHHGKGCCSTAREWLFSMDHSQLSGQHKFTGPRWLRKKYKWGPSRWPMTWCQAVEEEFLDCGALADLSRHVFDSRGVGCYSIQLIQQYTEDTTAHWAKKWSDYLASTHWIQKDFIYHEVCGVKVNDDEIRIWDPSAGSWMNPTQPRGYGAVVALRLTPDLPQSLRRLRWGHHLIECGKWGGIHSQVSISKENALVNPDDLTAPVYAALVAETDVYPVESV